MTPLTYLTVNALTEGIGASQVVAYVEALARRGWTVDLHSFERDRADPVLRHRLAKVGVRWHPHPFGRSGVVGGLGRVLRGAAAIRGSELVHARSDLPAASALLARPDSWVWDLRSFWREQRLALGWLRRGSVEERLLRVVEQRAASRASAIVTLAEAAVPVLRDRFGSRIASRATVIPTCVDLQRFRSARLPPSPPVRFLLSGTVNPYYDVPTMLRLVARFGRRREAELTVLSPQPTAWEGELARHGIDRRSATPDEVQGYVSSSHVGLSVCRLDAGVSLRAAMPTKLGEFLASGRPVVVNGGLGDAAELVDSYRCGAVVSDTTDDHLDRTVERLLVLLDDPGTPERCRAAAEDHFDLEQATDRLDALYRSLLSR